MNRITLALSLFGILASASRAEAAGPAGGDMFTNLFPLIVIFGIIYLLILRPQQKRAKEHEAKLQALKKDDKIITSGGIYGTIVAVKDTVLDVKIANNVTVQIARSAVSDLVADETAKTAADTATSVISK